jgi:hypothetical protein
MATAPSMAASDAGKAASDAGKYTEQEERKGEDSWRDVIDPAFLSEHAPAPPTSWKNNALLNEAIFENLVDDAEKLKRVALDQQKNGGAVDDDVSQERDKFSFPKNAKGKFSYVGNDSGRNLMHARFERALETDSMCAALQSKFSNDSSVELADVLTSAGVSKENSKFSEQVITNLRTFAFDNFPQFEDDRTGKEGRLILSEVTVKDGKFSEKTGITRDLVYRRLYLYNAGKIKEFDSDEVTSNYLCCNGLCWEDKHFAYDTSATHSHNGSLTVINIEDQLIDIYFDQEDIAYVNRVEMPGRPQGQAREDCCRKLLCYFCYLTKACCNFLCSAKWWSFEYTALDNATDVDDMVMQETKAVKFDIENRSKKEYNTMLSGLHRIHITYLDTSDRKIKKCTVTLDPEENNREVMSFIAFASKPPLLLCRGDALVTGSWDLDGINHSHFSAFSFSSSGNKKFRSRKANKKCKKWMWRILVFLVLAAALSGIVVGIIIAVMDTKEEQMCGVCGDLLEAKGPNLDEFSPKFAHDTSQWTIKSNNMIDDKNRKCVVLKPDSAGNNKNTWWMKLQVRSSRISKFASISEWINSVCIYSTSFSDIGGFNATTIDCRGYQDDDLGNNVVKEQKHVLKCRNENNSTDFTPVKEEKNEGSGSESRR